MEVPGAPEDVTMCLVSEESALRKPVDSAALRFLDRVTARALKSGGSGGDTSCKAVDAVST